MPHIQDMHLHVLLNNPKEAVVSAIIDALTEGFEQNTGMQKYYYELNPLS